MRLIEADIVGFGKFQNQKIIFDPHFQFIFGENEGGKSTLFQFIQTILFGFQKRGKNQKDYTPKNGAGFGGHLFLETKYGKVKVSRFKEDKEAKVYIFENQTQGGDKLLKDLLGPITRETFLNVYSFQENQLDDKNNVTEEELQQQLLLFGLTGSDALLNLEKSVKEKEQKIFKKNGRQPLLNKKLEEYQSLKEQIQKQQQQESRYQELLGLLKRDDARKIDLKRQLHEVEEDLNWLRKQKVYQPLMKEWETLKDVPPVHFLKEDIEQAQVLYQEYEENQRQIRHLQVDLKNHSGLKEASEEDYLWYKNHLPEMEQGKTILTKLQEQKEAEVVLDEKIKGKVEQLAFFEKNYGFNRQEPPQDLTPEKRELVASSLERLALEKEKRQQLMMKSPEKPSLLPVYAAGGLGILLIIASFFVKDFVKILLLTLGIACLLASGITLLKQKPKKEEETEETLTRRIESWEGEIRQLQKQLHLGNLPLSEVIEEENPAKIYQETLKQHIDLEKTQQQLLKEKEQQLEKVSRVIPFLKNQQDPSAMFFSYLEEMEKVQFAIEKNDVRSIEEELLHMQKEVASLEEAAAPFLQRLSLTYLYEVPQKIEMLKQLAQKNQRKDEIYPQIKDFLQEGVFILKDEDELLAQRKSFQEELMTVNERAQANKAQADFLVENGTLEVLLQEEANLKTQLQALTKDYMQQRLMGNFIHDLSRELSEQSLPNLLATVGEIFRYLTLNRYERVFFFQESLQVQDKEGVLWSLKDLSTGTKDQLLFAFRFAFISLQGAENAGPVIIDDGWLRYDEKRKRQFLKLLTQSIENQVLLLSSDEKMKELVKQQQQEILSLNDLPR